MIMPTKASSKSTISTNELRFSFNRVLEAVKGGRTLTLTYRNKPLAKIVPVSGDETLASSDPICRLAEIAEPMGNLTNEDLDHLIYGP
jgi:prevent-host-death family protein